MLIDWFTVFAQIINFLILLLLLQRFLYGPIVRAMDERTARIAAETATSAELRATAQTEIDTYRQQQAELETQRHTLMQAAEAAAETERTVLVQAARAEVEQMRQHWLQGVAQEAEDFLADLQQRAGQEVLQIARQSLSDLADVALETQMAEVFAAQLTALPAETWRVLLDGEPLMMVSAQPLPPTAHQRLSAVVDAAAGGAYGLTFVTEPTLIGGLELRSHAHKINWNLAGYLDQLREGFAAALDGQRRVAG